VSSPERAHDRTFPTLNAVRSAGALMVVATHSAFNTGEILRGWPGAILGRLDFGVPLFFVLSGFLLSRPFFLAIGRGTQHPSIKHYLWKRFLRIMPLYWLVVTVALIFTPANHGLGPGVWIRNLTLTQLYAPTLLPEALTQMWSLATEVLFYLVMPWLAFLLTLTRHGRRLHLPMVWRRCLVLVLDGMRAEAGARTALPCMALSDEQLDVALARGLHSQRR
jgi:peptidoglycan/LPS O-acetylase OafA/YrhL